MSASSRTHWIRYFVDYSALLVFLVAFFATGRDITKATWALVAGSSVALAVGLAVERRLAPFPLIAGGAALVFGSLSLIFHDPRLLKIKPTVMNTAFAAALLGGLALRKNPLKLVLDATVGRNALAQENIFGNQIGVSGIVMTKLDGTARGGVLVPVAQASDSPIKLLGVGEGVDDLQPFNARAFARSLVGLTEPVR